MNIRIFNKKLFQMLNILVLVCIGLLFLNCEKDSSVTKPKETFELVNLTEPSHYLGIAIYTADMAKNQSTEVNSEWVIRKSASVKTTSEILRKGYNAMQKITIERFINATDYMEFVVAIQGKLVNKVPVPDDFLKDLTGISFRAVSFNTPIIRSPKHKWSRNQESKFRGKYRPNAILHYGYYRQKFAPYCSKN